MQPNNDDDEDDKEAVSLELEALESILDDAFRIMSRDDDGSEHGGGGGTRVEVCLLASFGFLNIRDRLKPFSSTSSLCLSRPPLIPFPSSIPPPPKKKPDRHPGPERRPGLPHPPRHSSKQRLPLPNPADSRLPRRAAPLAGRRRRRRRVSGLLLLLRPGGSRAVRLGRGAARARGAVRGG